MTLNVKVVSLPPFPVPGDNESTDFYRCWYCRTERYVRIQIQFHANMIPQKPEVKFILKDIPESLFLNIEFGID